MEARYQSFAVLMLVRLDPEHMQTTVLTLALDPTSQAFFDRLRQQHYPPALNRIPAHLTLFHKLPPHAEIEAALTQAARHEPFPMQVTDLRSLGRGIAYTLHSPELATLHRSLASTFADHLTPQDRQPFRPHTVIQNKSTPESARQLLTTLQRDFHPFEVHAQGLTLWNYLGGLWQHAASFPFR